MVAAGRTGAGQLRWRSTSNETVRKTIIIITIMSVKSSKPGYKTTEFWLTTVCSLVGILYASGAVSPEGSDGVSKVIALVASVLAAMGYTVARAKVKSGS